MWAITAKEARMPVNADHDANGLVLLGAGPRGNYRAAVLRRNQAAGARATGVQLHSSHFATCPQADVFRKGQRK